MKQHKQIIIIKNIFMDLFKERLVGNDLVDFHAENMVRVCPVWVRCNAQNDNDRFPHNLIIIFNLMIWKITIWKITSCAEMWIFILFSDVNGINMCDT